MSPSMSTEPRTPMITPVMKTLACLAAGAALLAAAPASAADAAAAKKTVTEVCQACHGADGNSASADFPRLGGQHQDYLAKALRDYKSGARKNPIMAGFAATLSNSDIDNLAAYYASQPAAVHDKF
jgi:cytochrome c553